MTDAEAGLTVTVTTLVLLLPPQPAMARSKIVPRLSNSRK